MTMTAAEPTVLDAGRLAVQEVKAIPTKDQQEESPSINEEKEDGGSFDNGNDILQPDTNNSNTPLTIDILNRLDEAKTLWKDDKIILAAHLLRGIDGVHLQPVHHEILNEAAILQQLLGDNTTSLDNQNNGRTSGDNDGGWIKQGEHHGQHNFSLYYHHHTSNQLSCRIETLTHPDLLVPILSVLNESELYACWLPNYNVPRLKVVRSEKWEQTGRCTQIVNVETEVPWPLATRQVILKAVACDNIDAYPEEDECLGKNGGRILIRLQSLDCQDNAEGHVNIPPVKKNTCRTHVSGGFTIEKCPSNHLLKQSVMKRAANTSSSTAAVDDLVLVTFSFTVDPQLAVIPKSFVNFFLRVAMSQMWNMFLNIAEQVKEGKRPEHSKAIKEKKELYNWIEERTRVMLSQQRL